MAVEDLNLDDEFQAVYILKHRAGSDSESSEMKPLLQTLPLLGQVTCSDKGHAKIQAILQLPRTQAHKQWEIVLWYSVDKSKWLESAFHQLDTVLEPQDVQADSETTVSLYFSTSIKFESSVSFTVKFRRGPDAEWIWVRDEYGFDDGVVLRASSGSPSEDISDLLRGLSPEWTATEVMSQTPQTRLWSLQTEIPCPDGDESSFHSVPIGTPWGSFMRWFALVRQSTPWLAPRQGKSSISLDKDAILSAFLGPNGRYLVLLPISGINDTSSVIRSTDNESLSFHTRCDATRDSGSTQGTMLVSEGRELDRTVAAVMYHARNLMRQQSTAIEAEQPADLDTEDDVIGPMWLEHWYDGLGYCTWNSLGQNLTEAKLIHAVDSLYENDIQISSLIIDDNWQSVDSHATDQFQRGLLDFGADKKAFPQGLKAPIQKLKLKYRTTLQYVAVWHSLLGYWGGISPDGELAKKYKTVEVARQESGNGDIPLGGKMTVIAKEHVNKFYDDFYNSLRYSGVNAVKADAQFMVDTFTKSEARRELIQEYLDAWNLQALRHFRLRAVSCMSQFPQALFHSDMKIARPAFLVRSSDDYFPNEPQSHAWHIWANAHNAIFMQHLSVIPDWDMFQTKHDYGAFHAAARCVSGGPVYITDVPGEYDMDLIRQISGKTPRGKTVIFRPSVIGKSISPLSGYHDDILLKVGSYHGASHTGTPILGIFNVSQRPLAELIPLDSFSGVVPELQYVVHAHTTGKVSAPIGLESSASLISMSLDVAGFEILTACPLGSVDSDKHGIISVANLGLLGKMTGCAAITSHKISKHVNGRVFVETNMKALGVLGLYISTLDEMTIDDDFMITIQGRPIPRHTVRVSKNSDFVLEADIEAAWLEMELSSGWSNEAQVKITFAS